jgi:peptidoglycan/xylan/chitin deacetylase (PgdA/CDA1 family)
MSFAKKIISRVRRECKYVLNDLKATIGMTERFYRNARGARIVCYHGVCKTDHLRFNNIFLTLKMFEEHLQFYKKYFNVISLEDYYAQRFSNDKFNICISFDDGYQNNYKYVLPLLKKYQLPATFFITAVTEAGYNILWNDFLAISSKYGEKKVVYKNDTFYKDKHGKYVSIANESLVERIRSGGYDLKIEMMKLFPSIHFTDKKNDQDFWLQMRPFEIKELSECKLCTIGSHSYYHNDLARLNIEDARDELIRSKQFLEQITGKAITAFAFPYGTYSRMLVDEAKKAGYNKLLALNFHFAEDNVDKTMRERLIVNPYISASNQMIATIKGQYF